MPAEAGRTTVRAASLLAGLAALLLPLAAITAVGAVSMLSTQTPFKVT